MGSTLGDDLPLADPGILATPVPRWRALLPPALFGMAAVLVAGGGWVLVQQAQQRASAAEALDAARAAAPPAQVVALGKLQPRGGVVEVAAPTSAAAPGVLDVLVDEDQRVVAGQPLVVLDTCPTLTAAANAAQRGVDVARAALEQTRRDVRSGRAETKAGAAAARATADLAQRDAQRETTLFDSGAVTSAEFDRARSVADQAAAELQRAVAAAKRFDDPADVKLAEANLAAAEADAARAQVDLELCTVKAPAAGAILSLDVQRGERAPNGSLLRIADLDRMEAEVEVFQAAIARVQLGAPVRLQSDVLPDDALRGRVRWIGREVGRQSLTSTDPAANTDARVVRVRVELDAPSIAVAARFVGLEVIAYIDTEGSA